MMPTLKLPIVVCGERRDSSAAGMMRVEYESGLTVEIPLPDPDDVESILKSGNDELRAMPLDDILIFLDEVAKRWRDPNYPLRRQAQEYAVQVTGYNEHIVGYDFFVVAAGLTRAKMYDFIAADLGDPYMLDEWRPVQACWRRVVPRGRVLHVMVGNVPMAALFTMTRSIVSKNQTVAKLPKRDLVTSLFFALTCLDVDPQHPVSRSLSVLYWEPGSPVEDTLAAASDVVCVWGQRESVEAVKKRLRYGQQFLEFGPRRSLHLIGRDTADWDYIAMKAAYDMSVYDQEACFSPQVAFVETPVEPFIDALVPWLDRYVGALPRGVYSPDLKAHVAQRRTEAEMAGWRVVPGADANWTVIVPPGPCPVVEHPLSRTLYVFPVNDLAEALPWLETGDIQTCTLHPFDRVHTLGNALVEHGVERIVDTGRAGRPRPGFTHDGFLPLTHMVRWVSAERPLEFKYHYVTDDPETDDRAIYGWSGEPKQQRPYAFRPADSAYGYRGSD
jgi:long-chain-fatty-acyl-CoA reductase